MYEITWTIEEECFNSNETKFKLIDIYTNYIVFKIKLL